jgi:hypothetical protein
MSGTEDYTYSLEGEQRKIVQEAILLDEIKPYKSKNIK